MCARQRINVARQGSNWEELESHSTLKWMFGVIVSASRPDPYWQQGRKNSKFTLFHFKEILPLSP